MLNFDIKGNGKEFLFLLHGFMENNTIWNDVERQLSSEFTIVKIDLPGHGKSDIPTEVQTMEIMAEKVKKVADDLAVQKFHLLGHSMGGYVSLAFAEKYPEYLKSFTLFFSTTLEDSEEKKDIRRRSINIMEKSFTAFVNGSIPNLFSNNEKDILEGKIDLAKKIALSNPIEGVKFTQLGMIERKDRTFLLNDFEGKIIVIAGRHDKAVTTSAFLEKIPDRTNIKVYNLDCGHNGHWEKPEICAAIINTELLHDLPKRLVF